MRNQGGEDIEANTPWAFYKNDGGTLTLVTTGILPEVPTGQSLDSFEIHVSPEDFGTDGFVIQLDDDGFGGDTLWECDKDNNSIVFADSICD